MPTRSPASRPAIPRRHSGPDRGPRGRNGHSREKARLTPTPSETAQCQPSPSVPELGSRGAGRASGLPALASRTAARPRPLARFLLGPAGGALCAFGSGGQAALFELDRLLGADRPEVRQVVGHSREAGAVELRVLTEQGRLVAAVQGRVAQPRWQSSCGRQLALAADLVDAELAEVGED